MNPGHIDAPAKLNLSLEILGRRPDGYHGIRSVVVPVALCDTLHWTPAASFEFACSDKSLENTDNLVVRAAQLLGVDQLPIQIYLEKRIPHGAGLGGGSSDAAALLRAAMGGAFDLSNEFDWLSVAAQLGSDVPLFLVDGAALIEGRGERVTALGVSPAWHALIVYPACSTATNMAYAEFDRQPTLPTRPRSASVSMQLISALQAADYQTTNALLMNDFDAPIAAITENIRLAKNALSHVGLRGHLSGSGSALFTLFESATDAKRYETELRNRGELPVGSLCQAVPFAASIHWRSESTRPVLAQ